MSSTVRAADCAGDGDVRTVKVRRIAVPVPAPDECIFATNAARHTERTHKRVHAPRGQGVVGVDWSRYHCSTAAPARFAGTVTVRSSRELQASLRASTAAPSSPACVGAIFTSHGPGCAATRLYRTAVCAPATSVAVAAPGVAVLVPHLHAHTHSLETQQVRASGASSDRAAGGSDS